VVSIIYGEPSRAPTEHEAIGGCIISPDSSRWACTKCRHRWGVASRYDFGNLADLLEKAIETTMWSRNAARQFEALGLACDELAAPGFMLLDDEAEASRLTLVALLKGAGEATVKALSDEQRDELAESLLHLLRFAERKAANG
jgi:hypothetical protein